MASIAERAIPRTGEKLPIIGLGTWATFDSDLEPAEHERLSAVLSRFSAAGGRLIDTSPMYGNAESVVGQLVEEQRGLRGRPFLATKVWTHGREAGIAQMERSFQRMRTDRMDLMQIHNLVDWEAHLPTLRAWKEQGRIRYIGITHYSVEAFDTMSDILNKERDVDFVQLPYSVGVREAEDWLLPRAQELGVAVIVMRPLEEGGLVRALQGRPLPGWARDAGCSTWPQLLLKFILGHSAVTCPIPATANPDHLADNMMAGEGPPLDQSQRRALVEYASG